MDHPFHRSIPSHVTKAWMFDKEGSSATRGRDPVSFGERSRDDPPCRVPPAEQPLLRSSRQRDPPRANDTKARCVAPRAVQVHGMDRNIPACERRAGDILENKESNHTPLEILAVRPWNP